MDSLILLFCSFISCVIAFYILFQFLNDKFEATYDNKLIYGAVYVISVCTVTVANMFMNTILNVVTNMAFFGLISYFLYYDKNAKKIMRVFETEVFFAVCVISEAFGACLIIAVLNVFNLKLGSSTIQMSIETMFSRLILIGLQNIQKCAQAYVGSIIYKYQEHMLLCDIVLNRTDD